MSGVENYARQMYYVRNQIQALLKQCRTDPTLSMEQREDISLVIAKANEILVHCTATLVSFVVNELDQ